LQEAAAGKKPLTPPGPTAWSTASDSEVKAAADKLCKGKIAPTIDLLAAIQARALKKPVFGTQDEVVRAGLENKGKLVMHTTGLAMQCQGNSISLALTGAEHLGRAITAFAKKTNTMLAGVGLLDASTRSMGLMDDVCHSLNVLGSLASEQLSAAGGFSEMSQGSLDMSEAASTLSISMLLDCKITIHQLHGAKLTSHNTFYMPRVNTDGTASNPQGHIHLVWTDAHYSAMVSKDNAVDGVFGPEGFQADLLKRIRNMTQSEFTDMLTANLQRTKDYFSSLFCKTVTDEVDRHRIAVVRHWSRQSRTCGNDDVADRAAAKADDLERQLANRIKARAEAAARSKDATAGDAQSTRRKVSISRVDIVDEGASSSQGTVEIVNEPRSTEEGSTEEAPRTEEVPEVPKNGGSKPPRPKRTSTTGSVTSGRT
jgi:hypothetical protein